MPYKDIADLPEAVRDNLPKHAQKIYRAAYNSTWDEYKAVVATRRAKRWRTGSLGRP